jgi:poly(A) polymerase
MVSMADSLARLGALAQSPIVARLAEAFDAAGFEFSLVGGPVRDAMLGREVHDLDFTTNASPDEILAVIAPLSDAHWDIGREFGTIGARVSARDSSGATLTDQVEITTYRADAYDGVTRKPVVAFGDTLESDLARRDFTVNAMALRLPQMALVDPSTGVEDLLAGILRTPSTADVSFGDDPLRMLRAARFAAQLGFTPSDDTVEAMRRRADSLSIVSIERVQGELTKLLCTDTPRPGIQLLVDTGLADLVLPEIPALRLEVDEHHHHKDVYEHSLTVLDQAIDYEKQRHPGTPPDLTLRMAALLHDIGKPATKKLESGGTVTFYHHDVVGAKLAKKRLSALRYDNDTIKNVSRLIELHLRFFGYSEGAWSDSAVRRYVRDAGPLLERLHMLTRADVTTRNRRKADRLGFAYDDLEQRIAELREQEEMDAVRPDLDGNRIQEVLGIPPGREVGEAYRWLLELRLDNGPLGEDEAIRRLRAWWAERSA